MTENRCTVADALRAATARLEAAGNDGARLDAEVLVAAVLACDRVRLITARDRRLDADEEARLEELLARRAAGEPVAYLLGEREFWSLSFAVGPDVLIPRPETEGVVEASLDAIARCRAARGDDHPVRVVDVGTGSGAIAVALAHEARRRGWSSVRVVALDRSPAALQVARGNSRTLVDREAAIALLHGDLLSALRDASVDVVASNPPYLSDDDLRAISTEVAREPVAALRGGGKDGTKILRGLMTDAARVLRPGGSLVTEIGSSQGRTVQTLAHDLGFADVRVLPDLAGLDRVVTARWSGVGTQA